jgi:YidC/Oxa1 family membrane protein insertase
VNPLQLLEDPLRELLIFLHDSAKFTWGWSIVVLTVIVRLILLPLFISQYRSARGMQRIQPQLRQLKTKYANDKRKQQEEMMRLFQEHKVNPFGSCLPVVFQIPVFIALYYVLRDFEQDILDKSSDPDTFLSFMWVFDDITEQFRDIGPKAILIALIYGVTQLLATEVSFATSPQTSEWQRRMFRFLPVVIVAGLFIYPNIPAGLVLYWMTTNLWTCGQQVVLKRRLGPLEALPVEPEPVAAAAAVSSPAKGKRPRSAPAAPVDDVETPAPEQADAGPEAAGADGGPTGAGEAPKGRSGGQGKPRPSKGGSHGQRRRPPRKR